MSKIPEISPMPRFTKLVRLLLAATLLLVGNATARADEPTPGGPQSIKQCREASNGCAVCRYDTEGQPRCSLPGIACQPAPWRCIKPVTEGGDSPTATEPGGR